MISKRKIKDRKEEGLEKGKADEEMYPASTLGIRDVIYTRRAEHFLCKHKNGRLHTSGRLATGRPL